MSKVVELGRGVHLSIRAFSEETGVHRDTIGKRIDDAGLKPSGDRGGHPVYRLKDLLTAVNGGVDGHQDPDELEPFKRKAYYQAEREKLQLQTERGELIPRIETEREQARIITVLVQAMDTLPDILERDCGATPSQLEKIEKICDHVREQIYGDLTQNEDADSAVRESA